MRKVIPLISVVLLVSTLSCSQRSETGEFHAVDPRGWAYGDTVGFAVTSRDSVATGSIAIVIRHTNAYAYRNIWLELSYRAADSLPPDTFNIELADAYGRWHGKGLGLSYQHVDTLLRDVCVNGSMSIGIRHIMRADLLEGIEQLGVIFIQD